MSQETTTEQFKSGAEKFDGFDTLGKESWDELNFDPNAGERKVRDYAKYETNLNNFEEIPEAEFEAVPEASLTSSAPPEFDSQTAPPQFNEPNASSVTNEAMNNLDGKEKKLAAEQLVDTVLTLYDAGHQFAAKGLKFQESKLVKLIDQGKIDPTDTMEVEENQYLSAREIVQETNRAIDEVWTPSPSFNEKIRPAMTSYFQKQGWGMTEGQYILVMLGQDLATKFGATLSVKRDLKLILKNFAEKKASKIYSETAEKVEAISKEKVVRSEEEAFDYNFSEEMEEQHFEEVA